jgi:Cu+-exporting ATPase
MHREHDPNEWSDWTSRLFPVAAAPFSGEQGGEPSGNGPQDPHTHAHKHDHGHHHDHDPAAAALEREARKKLQNWLAFTIGFLILAEVVIWLTGVWPPTWSAWYSPARWAAIIGTIWICHGFLENLVDGRIGADLALAQAALAALILGEDFVAAEVVFISLVGEWLEDVAYRRAQKAIGSLVDQAPRTAWVSRSGEWVEVPAGSVVIGEVVAVDAGATIPVDGVIEAGRSSLDTSSLTGESVPVDVAPGDKVASGQINQFGRLEIRAERIGMDSTLGQVVKLMTKAQAKKAKLQRMADRYARYFLPVVETAALATLLAGFVLDWPDRWLRAVAVLVVACPCPLVLATPATILAAWATLARRGVLVKSGAALEQLAFCDTLALDKTGTLTLGQPDLVRFEPITADGTDSEKGPALYDEAAIAALVSAVERTNPHPLAQSIVAGLAGRERPGAVLKNSVTKPGAGVIGEAAFAGSSRTHQVLIGNARLMTEHGIAWGETVAQRLETADQQGETPLLVAIDGRIVATMALADPVRPEAHDMVHDLKHLGFSEVTILTGDRPGAAQRVGRKVHVKNVLSELSPTAKAAWIQDRLVAGRTVAMVGDGINDAPALAVARVGLAVSKVGANLATEAGDIILMHDPLRSLVRAREVSQAAVRILRQNILWFAFGLNGVAVVLAGLGVLSPIGAAIFHQIGSLAVLCNALRLLLFDQLKAEAIQEFAHETLESFDRRIGRAVTQLVQAFPSLRTLGLLIAVVLTLGLLGNNVRVVRPDESLVRFRKGAFVGMAGPGLHFGRPWPFESVHRVQPHRWWSTRIGGEGSGVFESRQSGENSWLTSNPESTPDDFWLTGDGQIIELAVSVQARPDPSPANLAAMVRDHSDPAARVAAEVSRALRQKVAGERLDVLLSADLRGISDEVSKKVMDRLANTPGSKLADLKIVVEKAGPPWPVLDAFRDSARAVHEAETLAISTQSDVDKARIEGDEEAVRIVDDARAAAADVLVAAKARADSFRTLVSARKGHANLTDFRSFWNALAEFLAKRPKMLLDTPRGDLYGTNAPRRHLILPDPPQAFELPKVEETGTSATTPANSVRSADSKSAVSGSTPSDNSGERP